MPESCSSPETCINVAKRVHQAHHLPICEAFEFRPSEFWPAILAVSVTGPEFVIVTAL
jgi:hypothetical protein